MEAQRQLTTLSSSPSAAKAALEASPDGTAEAVPFHVDSSARLAASVSLPSFFRVASFAVATACASRHVREVVIREVDHPLAHVGFRRLFAQFNQFTLRVLIAWIQLDRPLICHPRILDIARRLVTISKAVPSIRGIGMSLCI